MVDTTPQVHGLPRFDAVVLIALAALAVIWAAPMFIDFTSGIDLVTIDHLDATFLSKAWPDAAGV